MKKVVWVSKSDDMWKDMGVIMTDNIWKDMGVIRSDRYKLWGKDMGVIR